MAGGFGQEALNGGYTFPNLSGGGVALADSPNWLGTHVWDQEDNGTTNVPVPVNLQHRNNAAGTPAAGYGIGLAMKLDSSARTLRTAVELDAVWSTATDGAEMSSLALKALIAGAAAEVARFGTGAVLPDVDFAFSMGRMLIDSRATDNVYISHRDMTSSSQHGLRLVQTGATAVNCASGQSVTIAHANTTRISVNTTGIGLFGVTPVAQPNITGSRAGNAALADLLTKGALVGYWTDGTTA